MKESTINSDALVFQAGNLFATINRLQLDFRTMNRSYVAVITRGLPEDHRSQRDPVAVAVILCYGEPQFDVQWL